MPADNYSHCGFLSLDSDIYSIALSICHWVRFSHLFSIMAIISDQYLVRGFTRAIYCACSQIPSGKANGHSKEVNSKNTTTQSTHQFSLCSDHTRAGFKVGLFVFYLSSLLIAFILVFAHSHLCRTVNNAQYCIP